MDPPRRRGAAIKVPRCAPWPRRGSSRRRWSSLRGAPWPLRGPCPRRTILWSCPAASETDASDATTSTRPTTGTTAIVASSRRNAGRPDRIPRSLRRTTSRTTRSNSNTTEAASANPTGSGRPAASPKGMPTNRVHAHAAMIRRLPRIPLFMARRDGPARHHQVQAPWKAAAATKPVAGRPSSAKWEGAAATWMSAAPADSPAMIRTTLREAVGMPLDAAALASLRPPLDAISLGRADRARSERRMLIAPPTTRVRAAINSMDSCPL